MIRRFKLPSLLMVVLAASLLPAVAQDGSPFGPETLDVGVSGGPADNTAISVTFSAATFPDGASTVVIGRDDVFADSLASGSLQQDGPLLLVPSSGALPQSIIDEITRLEPTRAVILGGENAISPEVAEQLRELVPTVDRLAGDSRTETAIEVARTARATATTALLSRSTSPQNNPSAAFADALAAGGLSALQGWPVLLSQTSQLTESTRAYLESSSITDVKILGGTAALSTAVEEAVRGLNISVERIAAPSRAGTAIEVAKSRGAETSAGVGRVILVNGFSEFAWAAGFAAAAQSAADAAPIVLANEASLPPETTEWLEEGPTRITCAVASAVCDAGRVEIGFPPSVQVVVPSGSVAYTVGNDETSAVYAAGFDGAPVGLAVPCDSAGCTEIEWTDDGTFLTVLEEGVGVTVYQGDALTEARSIFTVQASAPDRTPVSIDAYTEGNGQQIAGTTLANATFVFVRISQAGQSGSGGAQGVRYASFQALDEHPVSPEAVNQLWVAANGDLAANHPFASGSIVPQLQRRAGAQMLGAAWAPDASGSLAVADVIGGVGLLRIAEWEGADPVEASGLDVNSTPHWLPDSNRVVVLADVAGSVAVVLVDSTDGSFDVVVDDAGDASGMRVTSDASGTFLAWRTATDIRVVDTRDGTVATIAPPSGMQVVGGPAFRG